MSVQCPLSEVKQTSRRKAATSVYDPKATWRARWSRWQRQQEVVSKASTVHNAALQIRECHLEGINVYEAQICSW